MAAPISEGTVPWPKADADRYTAAGYWAGRPLGDLLRESGDRTPDATALVDGDLRLTYTELADRADALALRLLDLGLAPGDRIVVQLANGWEFTVLTWACLRAGIVPVMSSCVPLIVAASAGADGVGPAVSVASSSTPDRSSNVSTATGASPTFSNVSV